MRTDAGTTSPARSWRSNRTSSAANRGGGGGGGGDLAESAMVSGSRVAVVAERHEVVAELAVLHVAQEHDTRRSMPGSR